MNNPTATARREDVVHPERVERPDVEPAVDVIERGDAFEVVADMPGVGSEGVSVTVEDGVLTLAGRTDPEEARSGASHREFGSVNYRRSFNLGDEVDPERISAVIRHGMLRVTLAKRAQKVPRRIDVLAG